MAPNLDDHLAAARSRIRRLAPAEAAALAARPGCAILDIRPRHQRAVDGEIPGSFVVGRNALEWRLCDETGWRDPRLPDRSGTPIVLCAHGAQSSLVAATLRELGFVEAADVDGGFAGWRAAGLPVVPCGDPAVLHAIAGGPGSAVAALDAYADS